MRGLPKYAALYRHLVNAIQAGQWKPGEQLPPEAELARSVSLSLGTVQRALRMLADDGILVRRHGHGTFVAGMEGRRDEVRHYRFLGDDGQSLLPLYSHTISIEAADCSDRVGDFFASERRLVVIRRIINVNLEFQLLDTVWLSGDRFRDFLSLRPADLDGVSLSFELEFRFNAPTLRTVQMLQCLKLPNSACDDLRLDRDSIGLEWTSEGYTYHDVPLIFQLGYIPPSRRRLLIGDVGLSASSPPT